MNSHLLIVFSVAVFCTALAAKTCERDLDCPFGRCNEETRLCQCNLDCSNFEGSDINNFGCSNRSDDIQQLCSEVNQACQSGHNYIIRRVSKQTLTDVSYSCNAVFERELSSEEQFCEDQSYCSYNGVCLETKDSSRRFCRCNKAYDGEFCRNRKGLVPRLNSVSQANNAPSTNDSNYTAIVSFALTGMLCMILVGIVVCIRFKRERKEADINSEQNKRRLAQDAIIPLQFVAVSLSSKDTISD